MRKSTLASMIISLILATSVATTAYAQSKANPQEITPSVASRRLVISKLKNVQAKQSQLLSEIDVKIKGKLKETQSIKVADDAVHSEIRMNRLQESMDSLEQMRREAIERSQFVDRLIFAIDTKWTKDSIKIFLEQTLLDIASAEMNQTDAKASSHIWKFATYLSVAIRELAEPREDLIAFIDNYMEFSTITLPKPPTAFSQARSYTNGVKSESAKVINVEDLGDGVEKRVKNTDGDALAIIQGTTTAPIEPPQPSKVPMSAPNPEPTASQNSN